MENAKDWNKRRQIFMDGFKRLGIPRARLYLRDRREDRDLFRLIDCRGEYGPQFKHMQFTLKENKATQLMISAGKPIILKIDNRKKDRPHEQDKTIKYLYWVGANNEIDIEALGKTEWIELPLVAGGEVIGKVCLDGWKSKKGTPDSYDLEILTWYGVSVGQIIQNTRDRVSLQRRVDMEKTILEINHEIMNIANRDVLLRNAVKIACDTMGTQMCSLFLIDQESGILERKQSYGTDIKNKEIPEKDFYDEKFRAGVGLTGAIFDLGEATYINNLQEIVKAAERGIETNEDYLYLDAEPHYNDLLGNCLKNCIFAPLVVGKEKLGIIRAANKTISNEFGDTDFDQNDLEMFTLLAGQIAVALFNTNLQTEKENYLEDLVHTMKTRLQELFAVSDKFKRPQNLSEQNRKKYSVELEHLLIENKNQLDDFRMMLKANDPRDYKFSNYELYPLIKEITIGEKIKSQFMLNIERIDGIQIRADKRMLQHALHDLIHNAIQYSLSDKMPPEIESHVQDEEAVINIINFSMEIQPYEREKIFERYYRAKWAESRHSGAGIGLHAAKKIIESHNGRIQVSSQKSEGGLYKNIFSVYLSIYQRSSQNE